MIIEWLADSRTTKGGLLKKSVLIFDVRMMPYPCGNLLTVALQQGLQAASVYLVIGWDTKSVLVSTRSTARTKACFVI